MLDIVVTVEGNLEPDTFGGAEPGEVVAAAARAALQDRGVTAAELSMAVLDEAAMTAMNRQWKGRDAVTDVLAFALHDDGSPPLGDVYVCWQQAIRQAADVGESPARELARLAIHGTLHVLGWDHPEQEREDSDMWRHQERILGSLEVR